MNVNKVMERYQVDVTSWENRKVPRDVLQVMIFVYLCREATGQGPAWSEIVRYMGWDVPRSQWKHKFKRMKRWGLVWRFDKANSTTIDKSVLPFVKAAAEEAKSK